MTTASQFVTPAAKGAIEAAIAQAEAKTRAQILVVVATRSGRYDRAEDVVGVLLGMLLVSVGWTFLQRLVPDPRGWSSELSLALGLVEVLALFAIGFVLGSWLATRYHALARPFVPRAHRDEEVRDAALAAFWRFRMPFRRDDEPFPAILLYVSLLERIVHIAADDEVNLRLDKTPDTDPELERFVHAVRPTWCEAPRDAVVAGFRRGDGAGGIARAVELAGEALASAYPRGADQANQLPDTVIVLDDAASR